MTDVHLSTNIRYEKDFDGDGDSLMFYELISGPLSAIPSGAPTQGFLDPTLSPTLLYPTGGVYADGIRFNFGYTRIEESPVDGLAHLLWEVRRPGGSGIGHRVCARIRRNSAAVTMGIP